MAKPYILSRRERQILDVIYRLGSASAKEIMEDIDDGSSYSTIRTLLRKLAEKGQIDRKESGLKYLYFPVVKRKIASKHALERVINTFFDDSPLLAVNSLLEMKKGGISESELAILEAMIEKRKKK
jgi:predicted transcriptional regulator